MDYLVYREREPGKYLLVAQLRYKEDALLVYGKLVSAYIMFENRIICEKNLSRKKVSNV